MSLVDSLERWTESARQLFDWWDSRGEEWGGPANHHLPITVSSLGGLFAKEPLWTEHDFDEAFAQARATVDGLRGYLLTNTNDFAVRWTVLAFLYDLSQEQPDGGVDWGLLGRDEADRARFQDELRELASLPEIASLTDPKRIRWEIQNSCLVSAFERAERLFSRLIEIDPANEALNHAHLGHFQLLRALSADPDDVGWAALRLAAPTRVEAVRLAQWGVAVDEASGVDDETRIEDARHSFGKAVKAALSLPAHVAAALGRCLFIEENYQQAARVFQDILNAGGMALEEEQAEFNDELNAALQMALARSLERAGQAAGARAVTQSCLEAYPKYGPAYRRLAELHITVDADFQRAYEVLCRLADAEPQLKGNIYVRTLLGIGGRRGERDVERTLDAFFDAHPQRLRWVESALASHWPCLRRLSEPARRQWLYGSWILWWRPPGFEALDNAAAAAYFARALEIELRDQVFNRFLAKRDVTAMRSELERDRQRNARGKAAWRRLLDGKGTLGDMLTEVDPSRDSVLPSSTMFREWLEAEFPKLADGFVRHEADRINDVRKISTHSGEETRTRAEEACRLCWKYLELTCAPKRNHFE